MTVYIDDKLSLPCDSELYREFMKGKFTVNKNVRKFSAMGEDQADKQHNKGGCLVVYDFLLTLF